jgi:hypothetical protein
VESIQKGEFPSRKDQFPPGVSGNPAGRPPAGASFKEWLNVMADYKRNELLAVMADAKAPAAKLAAARTWLGATSRDRNSAGVPIAGADVDRICDRTIGRPTQEIRQEIRAHAPEPIVLVHTAPPPPPPRHTE